MSSPPTPNSQSPPLRLAETKESRRSQPTMNRSISSSVKGRSAVFRSWVMTNPLVTSAFDELDKGLAKQTRMNTLQNRNSASSPCLSSLVDKKQPHNSAPAFPSVSLCSSASPSQPQSISFNGNVHAFYHAADNKSGGSKVLERLKPPSKKPPLEVRESRARMNYPTDPSKPISPGGKWVTRQPSG